MKAVSYVITLLVVLALVVAAVLGYIWNIVDVLHASHFSIGLIVRIIGIVVPVIGAIAGWF